MREIDRAYLLELYALFDQMAYAIVCAGGRLAFGKTPSGGSPVEAINEADRLADELEKKFAETLTDEERGLTEGLEAGQC